MYQAVPRSLCADFIARAAQTWNLIKYGKLTKIRISEETITEINLLELQIRHPQEIITVTISKPREAKIGADWEWWLGSRGYWLPLRVQAKKLDPVNLEYPYLDHKSRYGSQIRLLIDHSLKNNPPMIPIYIFYNYWDYKRFDPPWQCPSYPKLIEMLGCGLAEAISVKSIIDQGSTQLNDIANIMFPLELFGLLQGFLQKR